MVLAQEEAFERANNVHTKVDDSCTIFYQPCACKTYMQDEMEIVCRNLTPQQVFEIFSQDGIPSSDITFFVFEMSNPNSTYIPANLLGTHHVVGSIELKWTRTDAEGQLTVEPS